MVSLLKDSTLGYVVSYPELMKQASDLTVYTHLLIQTYLIFSVVYLLARFPLDSRMSAGSPPDSSMPLREDAGHHPRSCIRAQQGVTPQVVSGPGGREGKGQCAQGHHHRMRGCDSDDNDGDAFDDAEDGGEDRVAALNSSSVSMVKVPFLRWARPRVEQVFMPWTAMATAVRTTSASAVGGAAEAVMELTHGPGLVLDYETDLDRVADAYAAMDERRASSPSSESDRCRSRWTL